MIRITLKTGDQIEVDSPKEASQFIHSLYWKDFRSGSNSEPVEIKHRHKRIRHLDKNCEMCNTPLMGYNIKKRFCADCKKKRQTEARLRWKNRIKISNPVS